MVLKRFFKIFRLTFCTIHLETNSTEKFCLVSGGISLWDCWWNWWNCVAECGGVNRRWIRGATTLYWLSYWHPKRLRFNSCPSETTLVLFYFFFFSIFYTNIFSHWGLENPRKITDRVRWQNTEEVGGWSVGYYPHRTKLSLQACYRSLWARQMNWRCAPIYWNNSTLLFTKILSNMEKMERYTA